MTLDEMAAVIEGARLGKAIQHRDDFNDWRLCYPSVPNEFMFYGTNQYRVAPEPRKPREWRVCVDADGRIHDVRSQFIGSIYFTVREVIE